MPVLASDHGPDEPSREAAHGAALRFLGCDRSCVHLRGMVSMARSLRPGVVPGFANRRRRPRLPGSIGSTKAHCQSFESCQGPRGGDMVLLSAICVQKPLLEFQKAKLAFGRRKLIASGKTYSIRLARPPSSSRSRARSKGQAGQAVPDLRRWQTDGLQADQRTAISAPFIAECLDDPGTVRIRPADRRTGRGNHAREQGECLFRLPWP